MLRNLILILLNLIANVTMVWSQVEDPSSLSKIFSKIPGTPRVAANLTSKEWLVVWRQGIPGKIFGRIIQSDGKPGPVKTIFTGIPASSHSLDVVFDALNSRYLLAYESRRGLEVQLLDQGLTRQRSTILIESGVQQSHTRLAYDPTGNRFLLFWLDQQNSESPNILKVLLLDSSPDLINQPKILAKAGQNNHFVSLSVARDEKTGRFMVMMLEENPNLQKSVIGYLVKPEGVLVSRKKAVFQNFTAALDTIPQGSFADSGKGFALWSDGNRLIARKINDKGRPGATPITVATASFPIGPQPAIGFDSQTGDLTALWTEKNEIKGARLNSSTGSTIEEFDVASSILEITLHVALSYNAAIGKHLAVWEDAAPISGSSRFRIRGGVLGGEEKETVISGDPRAFHPREVTISAGTTVKWINNTGTHNITVTSGQSSDLANAGSLFDQALDPGQSFQFRFTEAGSFPYFCRRDPKVMTGLIIVKQ